MSEDKMSEKTSDAGNKIPKMFAENIHKYPQWVFELRRTLYCKAKQEPKYQFYTLYSLICRQEVMEAAWGMVSRNKGAPGVDGVSIEEIQNAPNGVQHFLAELRQEMLNKTYQPKEVKRVYIPKANGKTRPLGIPTVRDRVAQAATLLVIEPIFEADFLDCSHGFRPGRSAHDAVSEIQAGIRAGYKQVYDADMASYFDSIPHDKLLACVQRRITDGSVIKLIRQWLRAIVIEESGDGKPPRHYRPKQGTPQGGVISPLLANLYLHFFDVMFHKEYGPGTWARAKLVRYADDFVILAKSVGKRVESFIKNTLEFRMGLRINQEKTKIRDLTQQGNNLEFLGYVFRREKARGWKGWYNNMLPSKKSVQRICDKISNITSSKYSFVPVVDTIDSINIVLNGWANYFSLGFCSPAYRAVDSHVQLRLIKHLKRRSQRAYRRPNGKSWYRHLEDLGYQRLSKRLRPCDSLQ
jgi:RNA-directed DNA polymerase